MRRKISEKSVSSSVNEKLMISILLIIVLIFIRAPQVVDVLAVLENRPVSSLDVLVFVLVPVLANQTDGN